MWDQRYGEEGFAYGTEPNDFLRETASRIPKGPVLCLGEGEGRNSVYLAQQGYQVTAVDSSEVGLAKARQLAQHRGVQIDTVCADLASYEIQPGRWAGVVEIFCHLLPELRRAVHGAVVEGLRPGGVFLLEAYTPHQLAHGTGGPPVLERLYPPHQVRPFLRGLDLERDVELEREVREGRFHNGLGAVMQVVAVKP